MRFVEKKGSVAVVPVGALRRSADLLLFRFLRAKELTTRSGCEMELIRTTLLDFFLPGFSNMANSRCCKRANTPPADLIRRGWESVDFVAPRLVGDGPVITGEFIRTWCERKI